MPIDNDSLFKSVQFRYRNERDPEFILSIEYHQTDDFGPTITIHNLETGPLSLPFSAFADTVSAVREENGGGGGVTGAPYRGLPPSKPSGGTAARIKPTRIANAAPVQPKRPVIGQPVRQPPPQPIHEQPPAYEPEPEFQEGFAPINAVYAEQHVILQSDGVAESFAAPQPRTKPRPQPQLARPQRDLPPIAIDDDHQPSFADGELPPEMSLRNGRALRERADAEAASGPKRIKKMPPKPGERGYNEWVAQQTAEQAEYDQ